MQPWLTLYNDIYQGVRRAPDGHVIRYAKNVPDPEAALEWLRECEPLYSTAIPGEQSYIANIFIRVRDWLRAERVLDLYVHSLQERQAKSEHIAEALLRLAFIRRHHMSKATLAQADEDQARTYIMSRSDLRESEKADTWYGIERHVLRTYEQLESYIYERVIEQSQYVGSKLVNTKEFTFPVKFSPPLECSVDPCKDPATHGKARWNPHTRTWDLLTICDAHQVREREQEAVKAFTA